MSELPSSPTVGRYQILGLIGRGGMGEVYAAYHPDLDRRIALKVVSGSGPKVAKQNALLLPEARAVARLSHPNVVTVYDAGTDGDRAYIAMEFIQGRTLDRWLAEQRPGWREALSALIAAGRGLAARTTRASYTGTSNPRTSWWATTARSGSWTSGCLASWRRAQTQRRPCPCPCPCLRRASGAEIEVMPSSIRGTPAYMAPEVFRGDAADARADQFSFCVALFEALCGVRPFGGEHVLSLYWNMTGSEMRPVPKDRRIPAWVRQPLRRGLSAKAADRFPSMGALIDALQADPAVKRRRLLSSAAAMPSSCRRRWRSGSW